MMKSTFDLIQVIVCVVRCSLDHMLSKVLSKKKHIAVGDHVYRQSWCSPPSISAWVPLEHHSW